MGNWNPEQRKLVKHYATLTPAEVADAERNRILTVVAQANPDQLHRALAIILAWRDRGRPFSANDVRTDMDAAAIRTAARGTAFAMAKRRHLIVSVGLEQSTDKGTHAKRIELYADPFVDARRGPVSAHPARGAVPPTPRRTPAPARVEEITVPVHRTRRGQFSTTSDIAPEQGDLFAELTS